MDWSKKIGDARLGPVLAAGMELGAGKHTAAQTSFKKDAEAPNILFLPRFAASH
jgi:hypothetical protein